MYIVVICVIAATVLLLLAVALETKRSGRGGFGGGVFETPEKRAGRQGEKYATDEIKNALIPMIAFLQMFAWNITESRQSLIILLSTEAAFILLK